MDSELIVEAWRFAIFGQNAKSLDSDVFVLFTSGLTILASCAKSLESDCFVSLSQRVVDSGLILCSDLLFNSDLFRNSELKYLAS